MLLGPTVYAVGKAKVKRDTLAAAQTSFKDREMGATPAPLLESSELCCPIEFEFPMSIQYVILD